MGVDEFVNRENYQMTICKFIYLYVIDSMYNLSTMVEH